MIILTGFPIFGESKAITTSRESVIKLDSEGEIKLVLLNEALSNSKHKGKRAYNTWVSYSTGGPGTASEVVLEAMLAF